ncbi:hypothetical protein WM019_03705 [Bifidobacterium mongoliense]|uniref:hypothetical protein n=1 Tax=Bifidobacterium mongoliense TaxID=518643 RepID=UPI0030EB8B28
MSSPVMVGNGQQSHTIPQPWKLGVTDSVPSVGHPGEEAGIDGRAGRPRRNPSSRRAMKEYSTHPRSLLPHSISGTLFIDYHLSHELCIQKQFAVVKR